MPGNSRAGGGFTLVELLLALGISALIALLGWAGLETAIGASEGMQAQVRRLGELQRALNLFEEDLAQVHARGITNGLGSQESAFRGGAFGEALLEFTRGGVFTPALPARSELRRVRYVVEEDRLWRHSWVVLDRVDEGGPAESVLVLDDLESVELVFLAPPSLGATLPDFLALTRGDAWWESQWLSPAAAPEAGPALPVAVRLRLRLADFGEVTRVVELPW